MANPGKVYVMTSSTFPRLFGVAAKVCDRIRQCERECSTFLANSPVECRFLSDAVNLFCFPIDAVHGIMNPGTAVERVKREARKDGSGRYTDSGGIYR